MTGRGGIAGCYGLTGVVNALWGASLAATDARLELGAGRLGAVLMAMAVGGLMAMPFAGWLAERWTGRRVLRVALPAASVGLAGPAAAPSVELLAISAVLLGMLFGAVNVALSVQAVAVERAAGRPIMATVHGVWTLGAVAGGAVVSAGLSAGADVRALMVAGGVALAVAGVVLGRALVEPIAIAPDGDGPRTTAPRPALVIMLGVIGAAAFVTEGAATDWAGVHATRVLGADPATASLVYTVFFAAMMVVRFVGDAVRARLGGAVTIRLAGAAASVGFALVLLAGALPAGSRIGCAMIGWVLVGAGMAVVWPIVTSGLGAATGGARRLSAVTTISYGGGLLGPALIGYVAAAATLPVALVIPGALALLVATAAPAVLRAIIPMREKGNADDRAYARGSGGAAALRGSGCGAVAAGDGVAHGSGGLRAAGRGAGR